MYSLYVHCTLVQYHNLCSSPSPLGAGSGRASFKALWALAQRLLEARHSSLTILLVIVGSLSLLLCYSKLQASLLEMG